jgi:DNA-directed RNA polymerase subunit M/transcription elongation factor TFIIS
MRFCHVCNNMYYICTEKDSLKYICRNCGDVQDANNAQNIVVSRIKIKGATAQTSSSSCSHIVNQFTKFDPTLPRINTIACVNKECASLSGSSSSSSSIILIRYDFDNMKYMYLCPICDTAWKN